MARAAVVVVTVLVVVALVVATTSGTSAASMCTWVSKCARLLKMSMPVHTYMLHSNRSSAPATVQCFQRRPQHCCPATQQHTCRQSTHAHLLSGQAILLNQYIQYCCPATQQHKCRQSTRAHLSSGQPAPSPPQPPAAARATAQRSQTRPLCSCPAASL